MSDSPINSNINWPWILKNMRHCDRCGVYKTLDQFKSQKDRCRYCVVKRRETTKPVKPEPFKFADDSVIHRVVEENRKGLPKVKINLRRKIKNE